jgi:hypothetical protein
VCNVGSGVGSGTRASTELVQATIAVAVAALAATTRPARLTLQIKAVAFPSPRLVHVFGRADRDEARRAARRRVPPDDIAHLHAAVRLSHPRSPRANRVQRGTEKPER